MRTLHGWHVCFTRGGRQGEMVTDTLRELGAQTDLIPLIAFRSYKDSIEQQVLGNIASYDWIVLTSKNAVRYFFSQIHANGIQLSAKIAVIGKKTKQAVEAEGYPVTFMPTSFSSKDFVKEFTEAVKTQERILQPKGTLADSFIAHSLKNVGHTVEEWIVYETYMPSESEVALVKTLQASMIDAFFFTSPSAFSNFYRVVSQNGLQKRIENAQFYSIGPTTSKCMQSKGIYAKMPQQYTIKRMVELFIHHVGRQQQ